MFLILSYICVSPCYSFDVNSWFEDTRRGDIALRNGRPQQAKRYFQAALDASAADGDESPFYSYSIGRLADAYGQLGRLDSAKELYEKSLSICKKLDFPGNATRSLYQLSLIYFSEGAHDKAEKGLLKAFSTSELSLSDGTRPDKIDILAALIRVRITGGEKKDCSGAELVQLLLSLPRSQGESRSLGLAQEFLNEDSTLDLGVAQRMHQIGYDLLLALLQRAKDNTEFQTEVPIIQRLTWAYASQGKKFETKLRELLRDALKVEGAAGQLGTMTVADLYLCLKNYGMASAKYEQLLQPSRRQTPLSDENLLHVMTSYLIASEGSGEKQVFQRIEQQLLCRLPRIQVNNFERYLAFVSCYSAFGRSAERVCLTIINRSLELQPFCTTALMLRAKHYSELGQINLAIKDYTRIIVTLQNERDRFHQDGPEAERADQLTLSSAYGLRGALEARQSHNQTALADLSKAIDLGNYNFFLARGDVYRALKNTERALMDYRKGSLTGQSFDSYLRIGDLKLVQGRNEEAMMNYTKSIAVCANDYRPYLGRAQCYIRNGDFEKGLFECGTAIRFASHKAPVFRYRAQLLVARGRAADALKDIQVAVRLSGRNPEYLWERGVIYWKIGEVEKALADFNTAIAKDQRRAEYYASRGHLYLNERHDANLAIADYQMGIRRDAKCAPCYWGLGCAYFSKQDFSKALDCFKAALRIDPRQAAVHIHAANTYVALHQIPQALKECKLALSITKSDAWVHLNYARVLQTTGYLREAAEEYEWVVKLNPLDVVGHLGLASIFSCKHEKEKAILEYRQVLQLDPSNKEARANLEALQSHQH